MIWGIKDSQRIKATPRDRAICELCQQELIAKCGEIKIWHWAHKSKIECDPWWEPESEWHINWKNEFPEEQQEITVKKCVSEYCNEKKYHAPCNHINCVDCEFITHRADIKTKTGTIIELQSSTISLKEIKKREEFYGDNLIWLLNGETIAKNFYLHSSKKNYHWNWKPSIVKYSNRPIFIDKGEKIIKVHFDKFNSCHLFSKEQFLQLYCDVYKLKEVENGGAK